MLSSKEISLGKRQDYDTHCSWDGTDENGAFMGWDLDGRTMEMLSLK